MKQVWREEAMADGKLSPRAMTPRFGTEQQQEQLSSDAAGSNDARASQLAARLSSMQTKQMQAAALATARGQQVVQLASAQQASALQLDVLRSSHDGLSKAAAALETRLRGEIARGDKLKRQYEKAMQRAQGAAEAEEQARADAAAARAEVAAVRKELAAKDQAVLRAVEAAEAMRKERDDARLQASTRRAERDAAKAALAELKTSYTELEEARKSVQRQLEEARMCLIDEREARRAKEAERQAASESAKDATTKLEATLKQLERERSQASDIVKRGLAAEKTLVELEAKNAELQEQIDDEIANSNFMASDRANAGRRLIALRNDVGELAASILVAGEGTDPVRLHNEAVVAKLFEALAVSGGQLSKRQWAVEKSADPSVAGSGAASPSAVPKPSAIMQPPSAIMQAVAPLSEDALLGAEAAVAAAAVAEASAAVVAATKAAEEGAAGVLSSRPERPNMYIVPPLGMASPRKLARVRQAQHDAGQLLLD
jgi:hypothetical protein